jgi:ribosome biogenesis GTPase
MRLEEIGWRADFDAGITDLADGEFVGRVAVEHCSTYVVYAERGEIRCELAGRLRREIELSETSAGPCVGDWVVMRPRSEPDRATIRTVLPRRTQFTRKVAGRESLPQVIAANVDVVFLVSALNGELNPRRLERYLALAWDCGVEPVLILNKADLQAEIDAELRRVELIAPGVPTHVVSAVTGIGLGELESYFSNHRTVALLGSSGVGKSSLINRLLGCDSQQVQDIRDNGKGMHTTTRRELMLRLGGGVVVDTPGMRELHLWEGAGGVDTTFADVEELAARCRFRDCTHRSEPGCAVLDAVDKDELPAERLASYHKLVREIRHLDSKHDERARAEQKRQAKIINRGLYKRLFEKRRY